MKRMVNSEDRFDRDANRYAAYLESPEGRLRADLTFANLQDLLPTERGVEPLSALDLGCGTGAASIRLARLGMNVTALDSSPAMLDLAARTIAEAGVSDNISLKHGDIAQVAGIFPEQSFDIVLCHNVLEFVDDPCQVLRTTSRVMRNSSSILSILVRSQAGEVLKAALATGDLAAAESSLNADWGQESLYGGKTRLFKPEAVEAMLHDASLALTARRGVRVITDYLPAQISRLAQYDRIFLLERKLGARKEFLDVARYIHCLARLATSPAEGKP